MLAIHIESVISTFNLDKYNLVVNRLDSWLEHKTNCYVFVEENVDELHEDHALDMAKRLYTSVLKKAPEHIDPIRNFLDDFNRYREQHMQVPANSPVTPQT